MIIAALWNPLTKSAKQSLSMGGAISRFKNRFGSPQSSILAILDDQDIVPLPGGASRDLLLVPTEQVLILSVALPLPSRRKRIEALPYAIEDRIVAPIGDVHLALADTALEDRYLACVVDPAMMKSWIDAAAAAGLDEAAIMPDALALPVPADGQWTVLRRDGRVLARLPDGRGFAASEAAFHHFWTLAGKPVCEALRQFPADVAVTLDLRQGAYARAGRADSSPLRRIATVAALGLVAHAAIATADTVVLRSIAARGGLELQARFAAMSPGGLAGETADDTAAALVDRLSVAITSPPGPLLPLLTAASRALAPMGSRLKFERIAFAEDGTLRFDLDNPDTAALDGARRSLEQAGLPARIDGDSIVVSSKNPA